MTAAGLAHFVPGGVAVLFRDIEVSISKVNGSGRAVLARFNFGRFFDLVVDRIDFLVALVLIRRHIKVE
jgi:hypothetical protein